jgi:uncharacterized protein
MGTNEPRYAGFCPGKHAIDSYGAGGFRFAGMSHKGSILALPSGIYALAANHPSDLSATLLAPLFAESAKIEFVVIGTGVTDVRLSDAQRVQFTDRGLQTETMPTGAAARTYNIVLGENRRAAAILLAVP